MIQSPLHLTWDWLLESVTPTWHHLIASELFLHMIANDHVKYQEMKYNCHLFYGYFIYDTVEMCTCEMILRINFWITSASELSHWSGSLE